MTWQAAHPGGYRLRFVSANGVSAARPEFGLPGEIPLSAETRQAILDNLLEDPQTRERFEATNKRAALRANQRVASEAACAMKNA